MKRIISALFCLTALWLFCGSISAQPKEPNKPKPGLPSQVTGVGETREKAKEVAVREAAKTVNALMKRHEPTLRADSVDEDFVRNHLLVDEGQAGEDLQIENVDGAFKSWIVTFRYNWWNDVVRHDRSTTRASIAGSAMFGLSILLLVGVGYVRLDEYTRHRYTAWLRAAGSGVVALILAGSYFFLQGW